MKIAMAQNHLSVQSRCACFVKYRAMNVEERKQNSYSATENKKLFGNLEEWRMQTTELSNRDARLNGNANLSPTSRRVDIFFLFHDSIRLLFFLLFYTDEQTINVASLKFASQVIHGSSHRRVKFCSSLNLPTMIPIDFCTSSNSDLFPQQ
jgi:hypothetical protein